MNRTVTNRLGLALSEPALAELGERLAHANNDADRMAAVRLCAAHLGGIIGTSQYWCDAWWADAVAPGYGTVAEAETELEAAVVVLTRLAEHRKTPAAIRIGCLRDR